MCKILSISRDSYDANTEMWLETMRSGAKTNWHGSAALFIDEDKGEHALFRSMEWSDVEELIETKPEWTRVLIHQRYGTRGARDIFNTHFWQVGSQFYCHNGVLRGDEVNDFEVDSHAIGHKLADEGLWPTLQFLQGQAYANVFIVDMDSQCFYVSRSETNTLFSDGNGNYSTDKIEGVCDTPLSPNTIIRHDFLAPLPEWSPKSFGNYMGPVEDDYESLVEQSINGTARKDN